MATVPRIWSVRFLQVVGPPAMLTYTVPSGYRAVVRSVNMISWASTANYYVLYLHGVAVHRHDFQAAYASDDLDLRQVCYETEAIQVATGGAEVRGMVSGYLFTDPTGGAMADALPVEILRPPPAWALE